MNKKKLSQRPNSAMHQGHQPSNKNTPLFFFFRENAMTCIEILGEQVLYFRKGGAEGRVRLATVRRVGTVGLHPYHISYSILSYLYPICLNPSLLIICFLKKYQRKFKL